MKQTKDQLYEVSDNEEDVVQKAREFSIQIDGHFSKGDFYSSTMTLKGETMPTWMDPSARDGSKFHGITMVFHRRRENALKVWKDISEEIPGLHCPTCDSQAFKTDHKSVAVCGACPGWYFFFRKLEQEHESEQKTKLVLVNGEYVMVETEEDKLTQDHMG